MEVIKDFGQWTLPTSWNELTLKQYQNLERVYKEEKLDIRAIIEALGEHSRDEVDELPIEFTNKLLDRLQWLETTPNFGEPSNKIEINGETYQIAFQNKLKTGEFIAVDTAIKADPHNYAAILAILCRKENEPYDSKFENEVLEERIKMWEEQPIMNVMRLCSFFFELWVMLEMPSRLSLEVEEGINQELQNIENLRRSGDLSALSTRLLKRKLKKLRKSIKHI